MPSRLVSSQSRTWVDFGVLVCLLGFIEHALQPNYAASLVNAFGLQVSHPIAISGMIPRVPNKHLRCLSQNMAQKPPEKKMPSTAANAMRRLLRYSAGGRVTPAKGPVSFALNTWQCVDRLKETFLFGHSWDQCC
jgi:hypothetical protein